MRQPTRTSPSFFKRRAKRLAAGMAAAALAASGPAALARVRHPIHRAAPAASQREPASAGPRQEPKTCLRCIAAVYGQCSISVEDSNC